MALLPRFPTRFSLVLVNGYCGETMVLCVAEGGQKRYDHSKHKRRKCSADHRDRPAHPGKGQAEGSGIRQSQQRLR